MKAFIKGSTLTIEIPLDADPKPSGSGKSIIVASTRGNVKTDLKVQNKELTVSVNAYIPVG